MRKVLVITAIQEELDAILSLTPNGSDDWETKQLDEGYLYFQIVQKDSNNQDFRLIATSQPKPGPTAAIAHTLLMLRQNPDLVFMTGICAGNREKGIELGDIIIADMAFDYESGKKTVGSFKPDMNSLNIDPVILQWLKTYTGKIEGKIKLDEKNWTIRFGSFATGSNVISMRGAFQELELKERNVLALDMEAYSVLKGIATKNSRIPGIIIKGVCDFADEEKNDDAHQIAAKTSAQFMIQFTRYALPLLPERITKKITSPIYEIELPRPARTYAHRKLWREVLKWQDGDSFTFHDFGEADLADDYNLSGLQFYDLGDNTWLLEVELGFGAYNGEYVFYYLDERDKPTWYPVQFRHFAWENWSEIKEYTDPKLLGSVWFDKDTSTIGVFYKGRGIGDFGDFATYQFREGKTQLVEFRRRDFPDDENWDIEDTPPPEEWEPIDVSKNYPTWKSSDSTTE
ncbi:MAG TPA: DUF1176 domain-containing protein [Pyrinomonadaceae bacterium]|jgi:nucleoside phosphorylase